MTDQPEMVEEPTDVYQQVRELREQATRMRLLLQSPGWSEYAAIIGLACTEMRNKLETAFLPVAPEGIRLDGAQSVAYETYSKGILAGLTRAIRTPQAILDAIESQLPVLQQKIDELEKLHGTGTGTDDGDADDDGDSSSDDDRLLQPADYDAEP